MPFAISRFFSLSFSSNFCDLETCPSVIDSAIIDKSVIIKGIIKECDNHITTSSDKCKCLQKEKLNHILLLITPAR